LQYPGEKEITFPPFTCLESDGDPRVMRDAKGNEVVIFPLKVLPQSTVQWGMHRETSPWGAEGEGGDPWEVAGVGNACACAGIMACDGSLGVPFGRCKYGIRAGRRR
jgi:hypothetical protein